MGLIIISPLFSGHFDLQAWIHAGNGCVLFKALAEKYHPIEIIVVAYRALLVPGLAHSHANGTDLLQVLHLQSFLARNTFCLNGHLRSGIIHAGRATEPASTTLLPLVHAGSAVP